MPQKKKSKVRMRRKYEWKKTTKKNTEENESHENSDRFFRNVFTESSFFTQEQHSEEGAVNVDSDGFQADDFYVVLDKPYRYFPEDDLDEFASSHKCRMYSELRDHVKSQMGDIGDFIYVKTSTDIKFMKIYDSDSVYNTPRVKMCVSIDRAFCVNISVHGRNIPQDHDIWSNIGRTAYSVTKVKEVVSEVNKYSVCCGNSDKDLQDLIPVGAFLDVSGKYPYQGYKESYYIGDTIRSTRCFMLSCQISSRCKNCKVYRKTLKKTLSRRHSSESVPTPQKDWTKSKVPNAKLTQSQKMEKLKQMRTYTSQLESEVAKLNRQVKHKIRTEGISLSESESSDLSEIMDMSDCEIKKSYPDENSYQRIFWEQQRKYANLKDKRAMKWHPMIIKWCIFLKSKSSTTYDALRHSGFIQLPSERTLFDYTSLVKKGTGFQCDIVNMLIEESSKFEGHQKVVGLLQDEVRIKSDLVYNRHSGELVGFVDLGTVNNDLLNVSIDGNSSESLAKYVLVLMVRGVSTNLKFPFAHFATNGVTSDQLFCILWQAVEVLEVDIGLEVMFITSDGASPNHRFIRLHKTDNSTVYKASNIFAPSQRNIYFISDPPHLLKTARNCFSNSYSHKLTRRLWKDGYDLSWLQIVDLYKDHCTGIFRLCPKLTKQHIDVTAFGAMKVRYATQVLSSTVTTALELNYGEPVKETVKFIKHMDKFFDCLNVRNIGESQRKRNENIKPYTSTDDPRLGYLLNDFLGYFESWRVSVQNRRGEFTKSQINGMMLSYQTLEGLEITVKSVVNCIKHCLDRGMDFVLTEKFNQDPIEQHFGVHRSSNGCNTNPNLEQFNNAMVQIRMVGGQAIAPFRGNTRRRLNLPDVDNTPLPKRSRHNSI